MRCRPLAHASVLGAVRVALLGHQAQEAQAAVARVGEAVHAAGRRVDHRTGTQRPARPPRCAGCLRPPGRTPRGASRAGGRGSGRRAPGVNSRR